MTRLDVERGSFSGRKSRDVTFVRNPFDSVTRRGREECFSYFFFLFLTSQWHMDGVDPIKYERIFCARQGRDG